MKEYICIDIGGTSIKHGVVREDGTFAVTGEMPTQAMEYGGPGIMEKAKKIVEVYREEYQPEGICISTAGMVDCEKGKITYAAPLIPNYTGTEIKKTLEDLYGIPCEVENDVNCAGLAEHFAGASKGSSILVKKTAEYKRIDPASINGKYVFEQAKQGDSDCIRAIQEMCEVLGMGIANICYVVNPEVVVLGGGIMAQKEYLKDILRESLDKYLIPSVARHTRLEFAQNQNQAGMLGAYYHFRSRH